MTFHHGTDQLSSFLVAPYCDVGIRKRDREYSPTAIRIGQLFPVASGWLQQAHSLRCPPHVDQIARLVGKHRNRLPAGCPRTRAVSVVGALPQSESVLVIKIQLLRLG